LYDVIEYKKVPENSHYIPKYYYFFIAKPFGIFAVRTSNSQSLQRSFIREHRRGKNLTLVQTFATTYMRFHDKAE